MNLNEINQEKIASVNEIKQFILEIERAISKGIDDAVLIDDDGGINIIKSICKECDGLKETIYIEEIPDSVNNYLDFKYRNNSYSDLEILMMDYGKSPIVIGKLRNIPFCYCDEEDE